MLKTTLSFFLLCTLVAAQIKTGTFTGSAGDANTGEALPGVTVRVNGNTSKGVITNTEGKFTLQLPLGVYTVTASFVGYRTVVKTDIVIQAGRETALALKLTPLTNELNEVVVAADYFDKASLLNNLSAVSLNPEEIRRSPGSDADFQRILQGMPGVGFSNDQNNELLVRGGDPNENLVLFDNIELHSVNHYPNQFNSGGPISMVNVDLIKEIQFSTGGFQARYGNKLSSVIEIETREGNRNAALGGNVSFSFAGLGALAEGGFAQGRGSWLFSVKKSYLDFIIGPIGLTAVPRYYDAQWKAVYDLSNRHKISFSGIYGNDKIDIAGSDEHTNVLLAGTADTLTLDNVDVKQHQYAYGVTLKSFWTKELYSVVTLFGNNYHYDIGLTQDLLRFAYNSNGVSGSRSLLKRDKTYSQLTDEGEYAVKADVRYIFSPAYELETGFSFRTGFYKSNVFVAADTARYDLDKNGIFEAGPVVRPEGLVNDNIDAFTQYRQYAYLNNRFQLFNNRLLINGGLRYDRFTYSGASNFSPRFSVSWFLVPQLTSLNAAAGVYHQTLAYPEYGDRYGTGVNKQLPNSRAYHYIFGLEHIPADGLKLNIETYYKKYDRLVLSEEFVHWYDKTFRSVKNLSLGERYAYGVDIVLQQKLVEDIYGTVAFSWSRSRDKDKRIGNEGLEYVAPYEFPVMFTLVAGKRFKGLRAELDNSNVLVKYASYLLPFADDMEISFRWRYASGSPYTPQVFNPYEQVRSNGVKWTRGVWRRVDEMKSGRFPDYHRLDIGLNSRFNFETWSLTVTLSLQNIYNRKNVAGYNYYDDGQMETVYQFSFLPVAGIEAAF